MSLSERLVFITLIIVVCALFVSGVVIDALPFFVIQLMPAAILLMILKARPSWGPAAALAIYLVWIAMVPIWLFAGVFGWAASGRTSIAEVLLLFIVVGGASVVGCAAALLNVRFRSASLIAFFVTAAVQILAIWLAFRGGSTKG